ncbi:MAG: FAD-linked oxidase C-terminal domain-containing protein [Dehalococcoidia bacterium]|nr:oxidoreductase [Chloroflexota bacterium]MDP6057083.1 FAD-linked oxidase C-terminal domain-containing protein [Dehalococcoidia bacterium]
MVVSAVRNPNSSTHDLEADLRTAVGGEVRFDAVTRQIYSNDASIYQMEPIGVVIPRDSGDVQATIEICNKNGVAVLPRGGGTGLSGQTVNHAVVIDFSKYMTNVLEINTEEKWVQTQTGITIDALNNQLRPTGLFFTPDPSTASRANVGGAMGNNSCGTHSLIYGLTVDHVLEMDLTLSDGSQTTAGCQQGGALKSRLALSGLEGDIYRGVSEISTRSAALVEAKFPKIQRRVGGYNIDRTANPVSLNLAEVMVGSEGTLAAVTGAKLNLVNSPKYKVFGVVHFNSLVESMEATVAILEESPSAVEHTGSIIINQARNSLGFSRSLDFLQGDPTDVLFVEFSGDDEAEVRSKLDNLIAKLERLKLGYATTKLYTPAEQVQIGAFRQANQGLLMSVPGAAKPLPFVEDTAVSPEKLPEYVKRFDEIVESHGTRAGYYGHASVGCLHVRPFVDPKTADGIEKMEAISRDIADLVIEFDGSFSGEHGDGIVRGHWAEKLFGKELVQVFRDIKSTFDPKGIMNPGKIIDTPDIKDNLRYGPTYEADSIATRLNFDIEEGFDGAVEMCVGLGACRKLHTGSMCPSFMATRDEEHSTRGRSTALRGVLSGTIPRESLISERLLEVLDLCLECKSCKAECPANVDMAKIKYEYLYQYYKNKKVPLRSKLVADIHLMNSLAAPVAPIVNAINRSGPVKYMLEKATGFDRNRPMPKVVRNTFQKWFDDHKASAASPRGKIVLFHDTFMNFNHPSIGISATRVLEALGYEVVVLKDRKCCGRPMISKGLLEQASDNARHNVDLLHPYVSQGIRIVGCEASCVSAITDDWSDLLNGDDNAKQVAASVVTIEELLVETNGDDGQQIAWSDVQKEVKFFGHCHQKALTGTSKSLGALNLPTGFNATEISAGCCGMAGSFGYEKNHVYIATAIGEDRLFPAVRNADPNVEIATTGVSCREQIGFNTLRESRHVVEVIADALPE